MIALRVFVGKHDSTPIVVKGKTRKAIIDLGEIWIKKYGISVDLDEIEERLECKVSTMGDYIIIRPRKALEYVEKKYGVLIINNFDKELLMILGEWFKRYAEQIKTLIKTGRF